MSTRVKKPSPISSESIENFFKRLESYTEVLLTDAMTDIIVKIMVEVLNIFAMRRRR